MRDGLTQKITRASADDPTGSFLQQQVAKLVFLTGEAAGTEVELEAPRTVMGRGPGVDIAVEDMKMSRQHAVIEIEGDGLRIRDLGSTNGLAVNDEMTTESALAHGDRLEIGCHRFQVVIEERDEEPDTYVISTDD